MHTVLLFTCRAGLKAWGSLFAFLFFRSTLPVVVRAVRPAVGRFLSGGRLMVIELLARFLERLQLLGRGGAHGDLLARHEADLSDRNAVVDRDSLACLEHVAEFGFMRVP